MLTALLALPLLAPGLQDGVDELDAELKYLRRRTQITEVYEQAAPAVVYIRTGGVQQGTDFWGRIWRRPIQGQGSGVVILKEGFIVTNYHVVEGAAKITVTFDTKYDDAEYDAILVSYEKDEDLALLKIDGTEPFPTVPLGTSSDLMYGETVVAIGNPYGQVNTISTGIISGLHRDVKIQTRELEFDDLIQTDASINPGNSGGPLLNINGELIGINSALNVQAENIGFAIPVDRVREVLERQLLSPKAERAWLGFKTASAEPLLISAVVPASPADAAGLEAGDRIVAIDGEPIADEEAYRLARIGLRPWTPVDVEVDRGGRRLSAKLESFDKLDGLIFERLGLRVQPVYFVRRPYVRIAEVAAEGPAAELGLRTGDLLDAVRPRLGEGSRPWRVRSPQALARLVGELPAGTTLEIDVFRDLNGDGRYAEEELHRGEIVLR